MAKPAYQILLDNISGSKGVQRLLKNFQKLNDEIKKKESELKTRIDKEKDLRIDMAWKKYQQIVKSLGASEKKLEKEVNNTLVKIKKSADQVEKNIGTYKKKAIVQKKKLEKSLFNRTTSGTKKKVSKKVTTQKVTARKATKKASKKA